MAESGGHGQTCIQSGERACPKLRSRMHTFQVHCAYVVLQAFIVFVSAESAVANKLPTKLSAKAFTDEVNITQDETSPCVRHEDVLTAGFKNKLHIHLSHRPEKSLYPSIMRIFMQCTVIISTTPDKRILGTIWRDPSNGHSDKNVIKLYGGRRQTATWSHVDFHREVRFKSPGNKVTLKIQLSDVSIGYLTVLSFVAMAVELEVVRESISQGFIQTPGNDKGDVYWNCMDSWAEIQPPLGHVTLMSMRRFYIELVYDRCRDIMEVYSGERATRETKVWEVCGESPPSPKRLDTRQIHVHFKSDVRNEYMGFKLLYSYHERLQQPAPVQDGLWNCSVSEWREFRHHFLCDADQDCEGGEDEALCFFTTLCGHRRVTLDNRCYSPEVSEQPVSWKDANLACVLRGGHLASLNTVEEWEAVQAYLVSRRTKRDMLVGMKGTHPALPFLYRYSFQWADGSIAFGTEAKRRSEKYCGTLNVLGKIDMSNVCTLPTSTEYLCEFSSPHVNTGHAGGEGKNSAVRLTSPPKAALTIPYVECPAGHLTHTFLACDEKSACWSRDEASSMSCPVPMTSLPAMFTCNSGGLQRVPYSLVCDHRQQCADGSDENFCAFPPCSGATPLQCGASSQCVAHNAYCDLTEQCADHTDESDCVILVDNLFADVTSPRSPPAVVMLNKDGFRVETNPDIFDPLLADWNIHPSCPVNTFRCPGDGYCLPVYMRCNVVPDCPGQEDEAGCEVFICPGFYRCRGSKVCLHVSSVCDGFHQCPEQDDELYCQVLSCPHNCTCHGLAFVCSGAFGTRSHLELRYLDASGSGIGVEELSRNDMLIHLSLASCGVPTMEDFVFRNLRSLDLSDNLISTIYMKDLAEMKNLHILILSGNPLSSIFSADLRTAFTLDHLWSLDLSGLKVKKINLIDFDVFPNLLTLNLSLGYIGNLCRTSGRNTSLKHIRSLDMRSTTVFKFQPDVISTLDRLEHVIAGTFKLCCPLILPQMFNPKNCRAPADPVSSCDNLLSSTVHKMILGLCCCLALLGNVIFFVVRVFVLKNSSLTSTDLFVTHLAIGDAMMGMCVAMVALADRLYWGNYMLEDTAWRNSVACKAVGVLFLASSTASAVFVSLVSLDRFLSLLTFAQRGFSFKLVSARIVSVVVWAGAVIHVFLPLLPDTAHWNLLGRTSTCFPSIIVSTEEEDLTQQAESLFKVAFLVFNVVLVSLTVACQAFVYVVIQKISINGSLITGRDLQGTGSHDYDDAVLARRVMLPCLVNVLCWIPMFLLAVLARRGSDSVSRGQVGVLVEMMALPASTALRLVLHVTAATAERRKRERIERLMLCASALRQQKNRADTKQRK